MEIYKEVNGKKLRKSVIVFVERKDNKFLCLKRHPDLRSYPGEWSFIGGKCEEFDKDSVDAACREAFEEGHLLVFYDKMAQSKYHMTFDDIEAGYSIEFFVIKVEEENVHISLNYTEHTDSFWCPIELGLNILTEKIPESRKFFKQYYNL